MNLKIYSAEQTPDSKPTINLAPVGFPSPAQDYLEPTLDLNKFLIDNHNATFFGRVKGFSLKESVVDDGDLLIIDKSLAYRNNALAVCFIDGEFTLQRIKLKGEKLYLLPVNQEQQVTAVSDDETRIWGIVTYIIKKVY